VLRFDGSFDAPAFYQSRRIENDGPVSEIHAYAVVRIDEASVGGGRELAFEIAAAAPFAEPSTGLRAGWIAPEAAPRFVYMDFRGASRPISRTQPIDRLLGVWHKIALEGDLATGRALTAIDDAVENEPLQWFGCPRGLDFAALAARFGVTARRGRVAGSLRNIVVSMPSRFMRAWFRSATPHDNPTLQLGFAVADLREEATARFLVRYAPMPEGEEVAKLPQRRAEGTLKITPQDRGAVARLHLPLRGLRAGDPLCLTIERDHTHPEDKLDATVYLVDGRLAAPDRRTP
jgi:hypothetical protein